MEDKNLGRRQFLKLTIASAAAAGLSHFQFLNLGGADVALAQGICDGGAEVPDLCDPSSPDDCNQTDPDICPDPSPAVEPDLCPDPYISGSDVCIPVGAPAEPEPDVCDPGSGDPDVCIGDPPPGDDDLCLPPTDPDLNTDPCGTAAADQCIPGVDPDVCEPAGIPDPDECIPPNGGPGDPDQCPDSPNGYGDICEPQVLEPDKCVPPDEEDIPSAVELAYFGARWTSQGVLAEWETATELDNLGFNLYRSTRPQAGYAKLNAQLIPSQAPGNAIGAAYSFLDSGLEPGFAYFYVLEAVDVYGQVDRYGPAEAAPLKRLLPIRPRLSPRRDRNLSSR